MEENRKGPGVFYAVVGVATLVVAIIGATFAYFSASTGEQGAGTIKGSTQDIKNASLTLTVDKVTFTGITDADKAKYDTLVPAWFGEGNTNANPSALTETQLKSMISGKCEKGGYTGCHVYKITASSDQNVAYANLLLNLEVNTDTTTNKDQWGYVVFTSSTPASGDTDGTGTQTEIADGTSTAVKMLSGDGKPAAITASKVTGLDIHHNQKLVQNENVVYYLLVYVNDTDVSQNTTTTTGEGQEAVTAGDANYVVGSYKGTVELQAMGGKVRATFGA